MMHRTAFSSSGYCDWFNSRKKVDVVKKSSSKDETYFLGWPCVRVQFSRNSDQSPSENSTCSHNRCHCPCRNTISSSDKGVMGLGIPDPWTPHPVILALKSPLKTEDDKLKERRKEIAELGTRCQQIEPPKTSCRCIHHTSRRPPPVGLAEAFRQFCGCFPRSRVRKCLQCGSRLNNGKECLVCEISSDRNVECESTGMHPDCSLQGMEHSVLPPCNEEGSKKRRLCCVCRSKIKKALATDACTQTDKTLSCEKKRRFVEKEKALCCKHDKNKSSGRSRNCRCCRRRLAKVEECSKCRKPPVPKPKTCEGHHHCKLVWMQDTEPKRKRQVSGAKKDPPKENRKKICCLCHCGLKRVKVKMVEVGTQTVNFTQPAKKRMPVKKMKKPKTVCSKHRKEVGDAGVGESKLLNEKCLFEALWRCWNDHALAVSPHASPLNTSDISNPIELNLGNCNSAESVMTVWSRASELLVISPRKARPRMEEKVTQEREKGIKNDEQVDKMSPMLTKGCQTSFELLIHFVHTRRPEILRWFAESILKEIPTSDRNGKNKKHCLYHSE